MNIHRIYVSKSGSVKVYHSYLELITRRKEYWSEINQNVYDRFIIHMKHVRDQEKGLEALYRLPRGSLKGAHFIYGSGRDMREGLASHRIRQSLINGGLKFVIKLEAETREVKVFLSDDDGELQTFRNYKLSHNFFGGAIMDDPITSFA